MRFEKRNEGGGHTHENEEDPVCISEYSYISSYICSRYTVTLAAIQALLVPSEIVAIDPEQVASTLGFFIGSDCRYYSQTCPFHLFLFISV